MVQFVEKIDKSVLVPNLLTQSFTPLLHLLREDIRLKMNYFKQALPVSGGGRRPLPGRFGPFFSCLADTSIGDLVTQSLTHSLSE